ncbi:MAG TPA: ribosome maturation factor RimP [Gammaproteobacteria bacterium]|nr:ribosome maturation factor RimP [Gammaproteobacteria bacterium]
MNKWSPLLQDKLKSLIESMGYEFVGGELIPQGRHALLRIYIDRPVAQPAADAASKTGVTIDDCAVVSRQIGAMLDVENTIQGSYTLEVSSPGINRPLFTLAQYQGYIGSQVKIRLYTSLNGRRQYKGTLTRVSEESIYLLMDGAAQELMLPFNMIEKAHVIGEVDL